MPPNKTRASGRNRPRHLWVGLIVAAGCFASSDTGRDERARGLFLDACTACHTLDRVRVQRLGKEEWRQLIAGMLSEGVPLNEEETSLLVDYLTRNFGPEKSPEK